MSDGPQPRHLRRCKLERDQNLQRMDDAWDVSEDGEEDVDAEVDADASLKEDSERRQHNGEDQLDDVGASESHREQ